MIAAERMSTSTSLGAVGTGKREGGGRESEEGGRERWRKGRT